MLWESLHSCTHINTYNTWGGPVGLWKKKMGYSEHSAQLQQRKVQLRTLLSTTCLPPGHFVHTGNDSWECIAPEIMSDLKTWKRWLYGQILSVWHLIQIQLLYNKKKYILLENNDESKIWILCVKETFSGLLYHCIKM